MKKQINRQLNGGNSDPHFDAITPIPEIPNSPSGGDIGVTNNQNSIKKNKKKDLNFGFDMVKLDQNIAAKATKMMQTEFSNHIGPAGKRKIRKLQKTMEMEKERGEQPAGDGTNNQNGQEQELKIEEEELTVEQKSHLFMKKIPNQYKNHIKNQMDRQDFIDKRSNVKKQKNFALPAEITNLIFQSVIEKMEKEKTKNGDKHRRSQKNIDNQTQQYVNYTNINQ